MEIVGQLPRLADLYFSNNEIKSRESIFFKYINGFRICIKKVYRKKKNENRGLNSILYMCYTMLYFFL